MERPGEEQEMQKNKISRAGEGEGLCCMDKMEILMIGKNQKDQEERNLTMLQIAISVPGCVKRIHTALIKAV